MGLTDGRRWAATLDGLTPAQVATLRGLMTSHEFPSRSTIFQQGAPSNAVVVITTGRVRLSLVSERGQEFSPNLVEEGGVVGLAAALLHRPHFVSAEAVGTVRAQLLPIERVEMQMRAIPQFAINIARLLATFTAEHIAKSGFLALEPAHMRLARILLACSAENASAGHARRVKGLTHENFAHMVGASRTWVSLTLSEFERRGLIAKRPGAIDILDAGALAAATELK